MAENVPEFRLVSDRADSYPASQMDIYHSRRNGIFVQFDHVLTTRVADQLQSIGGAELADEISDAPTILSIKPSRDVLSGSNA